MSALAALVDGVATDALPLTDRGFRYGDGLFETVRIAAGEPVWWEAHMARLARGCAVLGLDMPDAALLQGELRQLCGMGEGVLRLSVTRNDAARGYAAHGGAVRRVLALYPPPPRERAHQDAPYGHVAPDTAHQDAPHGHVARDTAHQDAPHGHVAPDMAHQDAPHGHVAPDTAHQDAPHGHVARDTAHQDAPHGHSVPHRAHLDAPDRRHAMGLSLGWATIQLAIQPRLAGLKHLNRLEQVLAARECQAAGLDELLLCDTEGAVTSAIAANLFLVRAGRLETPPLDRCGVAGTCRSWILQQQPECRVQRLARDDIEAADELFLCNSVRGILPVARLGSRTLPAGPVTRALKRRLGKAVPAFAMEPEQ